MISDHDIVILSGVYFDDLWTSKQQIARRLAKKNRVCYVEPYLTWITPFSVPDETHHWKQAFGKHSIRHIDGMYIYSPPPLFPFRQYLDVIQSVNSRFYVASIRRAIKKIGFREPILWSFIHDAGEAVGELDECISIYHCADDWAEMPLPHRVKHRIRDLESQMASKANLVFSSAQKNAERLQHITSRSYYTPNGVDFELFNQAITCDFPLPDDLKGVQEPRLTFIGTLHEWVDYNLLEYIADQKPEWSIVIIGPRMVEIPQLTRKPNIHILGKKPRQHLPSYLQHTNVCLIPFCMNKLTRSVNPLKLYEYLAAGKPIVSTDLPEVRSALPHVSVVDNYGAFIDETSRLIESGDNGIDGRIDYAKASSWENRIEIMSQYIEHWLEKEDY